MEKAILNHLTALNIFSDIHINTPQELEFWGVDSKIFELLYPNWEQIKVIKDSVLVTFDVRLLL